MRLRDALARLGAAATLLLLAACTPAAPAPDPVREHPSPTATAAPDPVPAELVLEAEGFTVFDSAGAPVLDYTWADEPDAIVGRLSAVFGSDPETWVAPGDGTHYSAFDVYDWDGFLIAIAQLDGPRDEYFLPSFASANAAEVGGVRIRTAGGISAGSTRAELDALNPPYVTPYFEGGSLAYIDPADPDAYVGPETMVRCVLVLTDPAEATVVSITAPRMTLDP